jgi:hypothetical protein
MRDSSRDLIYIPKFLKKWRKISTDTTCHKDKPKQYVHVYMQGPRDVKCSSETVANARPPAHLENHLNVYVQIHLKNAYRVNIIFHVDRANCIEEGPRIIGRNSFKKVLYIHAYYRAFLIELEQMWGPKAKVRSKTAPMPPFICACAHEVFNMLINRFVMCLQHVILHIPC